MGESWKFLVKFVCIYYVWCLYMSISMLRYPDANTHRFLCFASLKEWPFLSLEWILKYGHGALHMFLYLEWILKYGHGALHMFLYLEWILKYGHAALHMFIYASFSAITPWEWILKYGQVYVFVFRGCFSWFSFSLFCFSWEWPLSLCWNFKYKGWVKILLFFIYLEVLCICFCISLWYGMVNHVQYQIAINFVMA